MPEKPHGTDPLMPDPASHPVRELGVPRSWEHASVLLGLALLLILPLRLTIPLCLALRLAIPPPLELHLLHRPSILLLPHLPVIEQPHERHRQPKDEEELDVRLVVRLVAAAIADGVVEDVVVEPFLVVEYVVLDEVCYPLGEGPVLLWLWGVVSRGSSG